MDRKNLDDLFREKFETFRETPDARVWTAIEKSLDKKRKKRVIPLWWQLGGAAAVLALALIAIFRLTGDAVLDTEMEGPVADTEQVEGETINSKSNTQEAFDTEILGTDIEQVVTDARTPDADSRDTENSDSENRDESADRAVADTETGDADSIDIDFETTSTGNKSIDQNLAGTDVKDAETKKTEPNPHRKKHSKEDVFSENESSNDAVATRSDTSPKVNVGNPDKIDSGNTEITLNNEEKNGMNDFRAKDTEVSDEPKTISTREALAVSEKEQRESQRLPELPRNKNQEAVATTEAETSQESQESLLEALEPEDNMVAETSKSRWSAGPSIAPVYFNALGTGSPIDPSFTPNSKSGNTNMSYGLTVAYAVTDKLSVRSGLHRSDYGYDTNNVDFSPTLAASTSGRSCSRAR